MINLQLSPVFDQEDVVLRGSDLTIEETVRVATGRGKVVIHPDAVTAVEKSRSYVERILDDGKPHYGINTGFGAFESVRIPAGDLKSLQVNLIRSHSAGVGDPLPAGVVRAIMVLRANALCRGHSGVRLSVIQTLMDMLNRKVHPMVPSRGSVGASGDLAPLAHIALGMIGEGKCRYNGETIDSAEALHKAGIQPVCLAEKEGLALINGTQFMAGIGCIGVEQARNLLKIADCCGAASIEALMGTDTPFLAILHEARPHRGQQDTAQNMRALLGGSEIIKSHRDCPKVQDPYSLRCIPVIHGAAREGMAFTAGIMQTEINSSVDNPLIFADEGLILSGGNFHGAPVALALETLTLALSFIANVSERRTEKMINRHYSGLPAFLARDGGLNSGLMIAQYTAAALASENKVLCHPACCDTIPTSAGQEDHVSMGAISALKLTDVVENTWRILSVEALCACEALEHRKPLMPGAGTGEFYRQIRKVVPPLEKDRPVGVDIEEILQIIRHEGFIKTIEEKVGTLK